MHYRHKTLCFFPSDLVVFMQSEYASWMERYRVEHPDNELMKDEAGSLGEVLIQKGFAHEEEILNRFIRDGLRVVKVPSAGTNEEQEAVTIDAMKAGVDVIFQARLRLDNFSGLTDFLVKVPEPSVLGDYQYEVWDAKLSRQAKPHFALQLCCYAEMLNAVQGCLPEYSKVILGNGEEQALRTEDYFYYYLHLKGSFLDFQKQFNSENIPDPALYKSYGNWSDQAKQTLEKRDHLSLLANITRNQIKKLEAAGINTVAELVAEKRNSIPRLEDRIFRRIKSQARLQLASRGKAVPEFEVVSEDELNGHLGLAKLPPASARDVYFDMEGYPLMEGGLEYLFGATYVEGDKNQFADWWAHDRAQEKAAFEGFIDWVTNRWRQDPHMHIYHYGHYEVAAMKRLMGVHGTREHEVDNLLRHGVFIDLYDIIRHGVRIGEPRYSIKNVEHIYRGKREGDVTDAGTSVAYYQSWIDNQDGATYQESKILNDIRDYNIDDCDSTLECTQWLRDLQTQSDIGWIAPNAPNEVDDEKLEQVNAITRLRDDLLQDVEPDSVQATLAWLLEFHRREAKPVFWKMFERTGYDQEELYDDLDCLAGLVRTKRAPVQIKKSFLYEYAFDSNQDTKLHKGSKVMLADDLSVKFQIHDLDSSKGLALFKRTKGNELPDFINLIPDDYVGAKPIPEAIWDYVDNWRQGKVISKAVDDFLHRRRPDISGDEGGPIIKPGEDGLEGAIRAVKHLQNSTLCIQGPPGAGKSYTGSHIIVELLRMGKRVGINSNSHKAINNLMLGVHAIALEKGESFGMTKIQNKSYEPLTEDDSFEYVESMGKFDEIPPDCLLIGGTAWAFANAKAIDQFDYLFIDEAGQVSIANLVAMGRSTRNIVLMGDQMQLGQPIQGSHPGESGKSILEYYLQDHATIPDELGIFLGTTWRMHPNVCHLISHAVYEGRLHAEKHTVNQIVTLPADGGDLIKKDSGVVYVPVEHEGNVQGSDEEVDVILRLVEELKGREYFDKENASHGTLSLSDILFVAPYNYQVRKLQDALGFAARVGSVDRFQGQEAPVVIISMCASEVDDSPRGLSFIFEKNRLNVAISRAQSMAIVVGNPGLALSNVGSLKQMELVNLYCRIMDCGK